MTSHRAPGLWWFTIGGVGLHWKDTRRHRLLLGERYALRPWYERLRLGPWCFGLVVERREPVTQADAPWVRLRETAPGATMVCSRCQGSRSVRRGDVVREGRDFVQRHRHCEARS